MKKEVRRFLEWVENVTYCTIKWDSIVCDTYHNGSDITRVFGMNFTNGYGMYVHTCNCCGEIQMVEYLSCGCPESKVTANKFRKDIISKNNRKKFGNFGVDIKYSDCGNE